MTVINRLPAAAWSGKGFPNMDPFLPTGLVYGFDFRQRASWLTDVTGNYTVTPKRVDGSVPTYNVTDAGILVPVNNGLGVRVELGYLQSSETAVAFSSGGATQFTIMVVGAYSGTAFPAGKVVGTAAGTSILYDYGSQVSPAGFTIDANVGTGDVFGRIEQATAGLSPDVGAPLPNSPKVYFLTYDGTNWTLYNKTRGLSATGTNTSLSVGNPIAIAANTAPFTQGKVNLGGNAYQGSTIHAAYPVLYQSAKWNRVLSGAEMDEQYARSKAGRSSLSL